MPSAHFRFYAELGDFLPPQRRGRAFDVDCARGATVKHAIEALGVPHTEVELVLVDGESVDFSYRIAGGERVSVYPVFEAFDVSTLMRVREMPLRVPRFMADAQLGGLARWLRLLGFDTRYENGIDDRDLRRIARDEHRVVLTRDRALLMARDVTHGCYVRALAPEAQLREVVERLQLRALVRPFSRCLACNAELQAVDASAVVGRVPPRILALHERFTACPGCGRVYWPGGHVQRMRERFAELIGEAAIAAGPARNR